MTRGGLKPGCRPRSLVRLSHRRECEGDVTYAFLRDYSVVTPSPWCFHHAKKGLAPSAPGRPCADRRSSMPGAISTSISAVTVTIASSQPSKIVAAAVPGVTLN